MFPSVTVAEVVKLIESAPSKASRRDIMPTSIMKEFKEDVAVMIANVANISFRAARFPQSMKIGQVTGAKTKDFKNVRPIVNLTTISKQKSTISTASPNYCRLQSVYQTGQSMEIALVKIVKDISSISTKVQSSRW